MKTFICDDCDETGKPIPDSGCGHIDYVLFDGYNFGDRMLESVMFKASIDENDKVVVSTKEDWTKDNYLCGLDVEHWLELAREYVEDLDVAMCPSCQHDIDAQPREVA